MAGTTTPIWSTRLGALAPQLADALAAFQQDLGASGRTTLTLCMTEFGRRAAENGDGGTDHGHGGVMIALGGGIAGGRVIAKTASGPGWPLPNLLQRRGPAGDDRLPRRVRRGAQPAHARERVRSGACLPELQRLRVEFPGAVHVTAPAPPWA